MLPAHPRLCRGRALLRVLALLCLAAAPARLPAQERPAPRNVVMIVADDHGQDTGAYGNPVVLTPHLDALASEGTLFLRAYATTASCSPSRSVILTGLHNHRSGQYGLEHAVHHFRSHETLRTLPVLLGGAGYRTAAVGKYHVAPEATYRFDRYLPQNSRNPVQMAENARSFISAERDRPFFLYYATSDPHRGGDPSVQEAQDARDAPATPDGLRVDPFGNRREGYPGVEEIRYSASLVVVPPWLTDNAGTRAEIAEYYQSVSRVDQGVGRLVEILKEAGVYENTLILYLSDHGAAFAGAKTTVYEPGLRSPLIVRHPEATRRGVRSSALVSWVDLTPTILDFAGVKPPVYEQVIEIPELRNRVPRTHGLHGRSFLSILGEESPAGWDEVHASHTLHEVTMYYPMRAVIGRRYKLIWNLVHPIPFPFAADLWSSAAWQSVHRQGPTARYGVRTVHQYVQRPEFELYDLEVDPFEGRNLADDPRHSATLARLKESLRSFQTQSSDPWLVKWERQ